ncbi:MAG: amino acid racemase [Ruminococcaceae bacterium]|nr:amino acid racemase [Oscillospiraceae bacterium]
MNGPRPLLGILGGLGPLASAYFYEMITGFTKAETDQEHIDIILSSRASTPDRTDFILGKSDENPLPYMIHDARSLETYGATAIVIPCNTAHHFLLEVRRAVNVPVPSIITETTLYLKRNGYKKACILATAGTIHSGSYQQELTKHGMDFAIPDEKGQAIVMDIIYNDIKKGVIPPAEKLYQVAEPLFADGCDCAILACTELSLMQRVMDDRRFVDSLAVLAAVSIRLMGHETVGFADTGDLGDMGRFRDFPHPVLP